jgi:hypothetical protein
LKEECGSGHTSSQLDVEDKDDMITDSLEVTVVDGRQPGF